MTESVKKVEFLSKSNPITLFIPISLENNDGLHALDVFITMS
ncbi:hypothetical protein JCM19232_2221 [Vibrio ishigakensis]|uniref:Uncharacterized protein n=1 Tax=Vibrio ishigakensis TaxID=1481914 RepID=A0A0B8PBR5_9VIBR|nr:hypothetical protein JCM19232_2221 [Vibrio ishigakensis]